MTVALKWLSNISFHSITLTFLIASNGAVRSEKPLTCSRKKFTNPRKDWSSFPVVGLGHWRKASSFFWSIPIPWLVTTWPSKRKCACPTLTLLGLIRRLTELSLLIMVIHCCSCSSQVFEPNGMLSKYGSTDPKSLKTVRIKRWKKPGMLVKPKGQPTNIYCTPRQVKAVYGWQSGCNLVCR